MESKKFSLSHNPIDYTLSVHIRNLMITFGEDKVRKSLQELFSIEISSEKVKEINDYVNFGTGEEL